MPNAVERLVEQLASKHAVFIRDPVSHEQSTELWSRLGVRPPAVFAELLRAYAWRAESRLGDVLLFSREMSTLATWEAEVVRDSALAKPLLRAKLLPFARPLCGSYDSICFDTSKGRDNDCPIVRVDHESVLLHDAPRITATLARSTRVWFEECAR